MRQLFTLFAALTLSVGLWAEGSVFTYTAEENVYGITVNGTPVLGTKSEIPLDPSFEELQVLNQSLETGDLVTLYNQNGGTTWVVTLDEASVAGIELNATGDAYIITQDGCYNFYIKLKFEADQLYVGSCAAPVEYKYTTYENWQIKYGPEWVWTENMTKVADGLYAINIIWAATKLYGFNIKSDDNPIKQDWYALNDPAVTVADGLVEGEPAKVTLRIVDDKTLTITIDVIPEEITVAEALAIAQTLNPEPGKTLSTSARYDVRGYVVEISSMGAQEKFYLADSPKATHRNFQVYKCTIPEGAVIEKGSYVSVVGYITNYNGGTYNSIGIDLGQLTVIKLESVVCVTEHGTSIGAGKYIKGDKCTLTVTPDYGYHFNQWNDGNTDNPRSFVVTQDTTFTAQIDINQYILTAVQSCETKIWPVILDNVTYSQWADSIVADFRPNNVNRYLYNWENTYDSIATSGKNYFQTNSDYLSLVVGQQRWAGAGFFIGEESIAPVTSLINEIKANPQNYGFHMAFKSTDNYSHSFHILGEDISWVIGDNMGQGYSYTISRDGEWHSIDINMGDWNCANITSSLDGLLDGMNVFWFTSEGISGAQLNLDACYFYKKAYNYHGTVTGTGIYQYGEAATLIAVPDEHYHFVKWSDNNTSNPRTVSVTGDKTYTAIFALDQHTISATANHGIVSGTGKYDYGKKLTLTVIPDAGYRFTQWNDGNTDNPRSFVVTQDTSFTAISAKITSGKCGDNLRWNYNDGVLVISGTGDMYDYTQGTTPWVLFQDSINSLVINNGCTLIGNFAFYGLSNKNLKTIDLPNSVEQIGQYAFANCAYLKNLYLGLSLEKISANAFANDERLIYITCYAIEPPLLDEAAFVNYDAYLCVPCESQADYKVSKGWKLFNKENISCIGAEETPITTDDVTVTPQDNQATLVWPADDQAAGYSIEITKDGVVFCTLKFNAQGQLTGIAFAPSRGGELRTMQAAEMTTSGWQFTVTGLTPGSKYVYTVDIIDAQQQSIKQYTGEFTTTGGISTDWNQLTDSPVDRFTKIIKDNHLLIFRGDKIYNAAGGLIK